MTKIIKVFIASSTEEFGRIRNIIGCLIHRWNSHLTDDGVYIKLYLCEDESKNFQPIYDRNIEDSDIFIALIGKELRPFTEHELIVAKQNEGRRINRKIIVFNSPSNENTVPSEISAGFEIVSLNEIDIKKYVEGLFHLLVNTAKEVSTKVPATTYIAAPDCFKINIPDIVPFEGDIDIIENSIRGFNDQNINTHHISVDNSSIINSCDAYVSILTSGSDEEKKRIDNILRICTEEEFFWIYENDVNKSNTEDLTRHLAINDRHYSTKYRTYVDLKNIFGNQLYQAIFPHREYKYIIEDHILKRKILCSEEYSPSIVKELKISHLNLLERKREEDKILYILESYRHVGNYKKLNEVLNRIERDDYSFPYDTEVISEQAEKDYKATVGYVRHSLSELQKKDKLKDSEILEQMRDILSYPTKNHFVLAASDSIEINKRCVDILSRHPSLQNERETYLKRALSDYQMIVETTTDNLNHCKVLDPTILNFVEECLVQLCDIYFQRSDYKKLDNYATQGLEIYNQEKGTMGNLFQFLFYIYKARACYSNKIEEVCYYNLAESVIEPFYNKNNTLLNNYIHLRYEIISRQLDIYSPEHKREQEKLKPQFEQIKEQYNNYLSIIDSDEYLLSKAYICVLSAEFEIDNYDKAISFVDEAISIINENHLLESSNKCYLYMLWLKSDILQRVNKPEGINGAISILTQLLDSYQGQYDKALCQQNIADCYMTLFPLVSPKKLIEMVDKAENAYGKALEIFNNLKMDGKIGNAYDGLSYCSLLKKNFEQANLYAHNAIADNSYACINKYCNYISSLLCLGNYNLAWKRFIKHEKKAKIIDQMKKDVQDMKLVGINAFPFHIFFLRYRVHKFFYKQ